MEHGGSGHTDFLPAILLLLAAAVVAVPLFKRLGLGSVLGYFAAGALIGPFGVGAVQDAHAVASVAELGVVMLLFVIGLELRTERLVALRRDILGLGPVQMIVTAAVIAAALHLWANLTPLAAGLAGVAFAISATSIALKVLEDRGDLQAPYGRRSFSVLLFQDIAAAPLIAVGPLLAMSVQSHQGIVLPDAGNLDGWLSGLKGTGFAVAAALAIAIAGRLLVNPLFKALSSSGAREMMTAGALLIVLAAAWAMRAVGLSMGLGAFLAGVILAESRYRHELEADIEPFRGLLMGLFFMSVGMAIDLGVVWRNWQFLLIAAPLLLLAKGLITFLLLRFSGSSTRDALRAGVLLGSAGEFSFVLIPIGVSAALFDSQSAALLSALGALTMMIAPLVAAALEGILSKVRTKQEIEEDFADADGDVLIISFGRFAQIVAQVFSAEGVSMTIIDDDVEMIESAAKFGSRVYFGDGRRLDVLHAAGAGRARLICVCVDNQQAALEIVDLVQTHFPLAKVYVRAYDRQHALALMERNVDYFIRETVESAFEFGRQALEGLGVPPDRAVEVEDDVRRRDAERLVIQQQGGMYAGRDLMKVRTVRPEPLKERGERAKPMNAEAERALAVALAKQNDVE
ncbi:MAG: monovalent cation:proton antiporter-2 (CPA2) family protein [Caulobacterales bacterium]